MPDHALALDLLQGESTREGMLVALASAVAQGTPGLDELLAALPPPDEHLGDEALGALGICWGATERPLPSSLPEASLGTLVHWTQTALARSDAAVLWAPWSAILPTMPWIRVADPSAVLSRALAEAPFHAVDAIGAAVDQLALPPEAGLRHLLTAWPDAAGLVAAQLGSPWLRAAPFPEDFVQRLLDDGEWSGVGIDACGHWRQAGPLMAVATDGQRRLRWRRAALERLPEEQVEPDWLLSCAADPALGVAAVQALGRTVRGPHGWSLDAELLQEAIDRHAEVVHDAVLALVRHHERPWCTFVEALPDDHPTWPAHLKVLGALNAPAATSLLERLWERLPDHRDALCEALLAHGSPMPAAFLAAHPEGREDLVRRLPPSALPILADAAHRPAARWLCAHHDGPPEPHWLEVLETEDDGCPFVGLPAEIRRRLVAQALDPADPNREQALERLASHGGRDDAEALLQLALAPRDPEHPLLGLHTARAIACIGERLAGRGVVHLVGGRDEGKSFLATLLVAWCARHEASDPRTATALELLGEARSRRGPADFSRTLRKGTPDVQKHALRLLGATDAARQALPFVGHDDPKLARAAADALSGHPWAAGHLVAGLRAANMNVRRATAGALCGTASPVAVEPLVQCIARHDNRGLQRDALEALLSVVGPCGLGLVAEATDADVGDAVPPELLACYEARRRRDGHEVPADELALPAYHALAPELEALLAAWPQERPTDLQLRAVGAAPADVRWRMGAHARQLSLERHGVERLELVAGAGLPFLASERQLAVDPRQVRVYTAARADRFAAGEVAWPELSALLSERRDARWIDAALRAGHHQEVLAQAHREGWLGPLRRVWWSPGHTAPLLHGLDGREALSWRVALGDAPSSVWVEQLASDQPASRRLAQEALLADPCDPSLVVPLLDKSHPVAAGAAHVLAAWGSPMAHGALGSAWLRGALPHPPVLPLPVAVAASDEAEAGRSVQLVMASRGDPERKADAVDALATHVVPDDLASLRRAYGALPADRYVARALAGQAVPRGVVGRGPLPEALVEGLLSPPHDATPLVELLSHWSPPLYDRDGRLPAVLRAHRGEDWVPKVAGAMRLWQRSPEEAVALVSELADEGDDPTDWLAGLDHVPARGRLGLLLQLSGTLDLTERVLDEVLPATQQDAGSPHPIDRLPAPWPSALWRRVRERTMERDPGRARQALWALRGQPDELELLEAAHGHPEARVQVYAHRRLKREARPERWQEAALGLLRDGHPALQRSLVRTLAFRRYEPVLPVLVTQMLGSGRRAQEATKALHAFGPEAVPALTQMLGRLRPDHRRRVQAVIEALG